MKPSHMRDCLPTIGSSRRARNAKLSYFACQSSSFYSAGRTSAVRRTVAGANREAVRPRVGVRQTRSNADVIGSRSLCPGVAPFCRRDSSRLPVLAAGGSRTQFQLSVAASLELPAPRPGNAISASMPRSSRCQTVISPFRQAEQKVAALDRHGPPRVTVDRRQLLPKMFLFIRRGPNSTPLLSDDGCSWRPSRTALCARPASGRTLGLASCVRLKGTFAMSAIRISVAFRDCLILPFGLHWPVGSRRFDSVTLPPPPTRTYG